MTTTAPTRPELPRSHDEVLSVAREIGAVAQPHAARHDREASFVVEGYGAIRETRYGAIAVPEELGGAGHDLYTVCRAQAVLARFCTSTALAIAMHQHNVLSLAWRWRMGDESVERTLRRVADEGLLISSSGSVDRMNPGMTARATSGGLVVSGRKRLVSGAPGADVVATLALVEGNQAPWVTTVLVPMSDPGVEIVPDWDALGMRGSGSNPVTFSDVFVPEENVLQFRNLRRRQAPRGQSPGAAGRAESSRVPGLHLALTVIAATYLGAAGGVKDRALRIVAGEPWEDDPVKHRLAGMLVAEMRSGWWALDALVEATTDEDLGTERHFVTTMLAKRQVVLSSIRAVEVAMELLGTRSYLRSMPFEQALRDVRAAITHPLAPERTLTEIGYSELSALTDD
jgi:acyl-CoA dehydrogenase